MYLLLSNFFFFQICFIGLLVDNKSEFESSDHVYEAIGEMLHEVAGDSKGEDEIKDICSQLLSALKRSVIYNYY